MHAAKLQNVYNLCGRVNKRLTIVPESSSESIHKPAEELPCQS